MTMRPLTIALSLTLCALLGFAAVQGIAHVAHAQGADDAAEPAAAPAPDPVEDPVASAGVVWKMYRSGALVPAIILAIYFALYFAARKVRRLREGKWALYITAALAGLAMLAERAASGSTPSAGMMIAALGTVIAIATKATPPPPAAKLESVK